MLFVTRVAATEANVVLWDPYNFALPRESAAATFWLEGRSTATTTILRSMGALTLVLHSWRS